MNNYRYRGTYPGTRDNAIVANNNRRARTMGIDGSLSVHDWRALRNRFGNICLACKESRPLTADHVVPLSCGGLNIIENIQPLCKSCNSKKHTQTIDYRA